MVADLWVVMPVYNEQESITTVINQWLEELRKYQIKFTMCILNDGSKDRSLQIIQELASKEKEIKVVDKSNSGHGQTCVAGYKIALENGADWIFQIDSDGQCDVSFFEKFQKVTAVYPVIFGYRKTRDDGFKRFLISRIVSVFSYLATGIWVRDANVPYRLMRASSVKEIIGKIPFDFYLANILVSVLLQKKYKIHWIDIRFRNRIGGTASIKTFSFVKHGFKLFRQLRNCSIA
jgi:dolichol-phosphate mannosyltransferase